MHFKPLYYFSKLIFNVTIRTYYRDIKVRGEKNLCPGKPVIIAMNHPNSFMDPIAFATVVRPTMNFLARGDAFTKFLSPVLRSVGIIPIYRLMDSGREGVQKNDETFRTVTQYLKDRRYVIIFAEGISIQARRLINLKKGCARIVLGAVESLNDKEIRVVPVGMNYQNDPSKFRHRLFIDIGEPILVSDYQELYRENPSKTINQFTADLQQRMKSTLVHIQDGENDLLVEQIEEICLEEHLELKGYKRSNLEAAHAFTISVVGAVSAIAETNTAQLDNLKIKINDYLEQVSSLEIRDKLLRDKYLHLSQTSSIIFRSVLFLLGLPIWLTGLLTNYVPYLICWKFPVKLTKDIEWFAALAGAVGTFVFLFYHLIQFFICWLLSGSLEFLMIYIAATFFSGWFSLHYSPFRKKLFGSYRLNKIKKNQSVFSQLLESRKEIIMEVNKIIS